MFIRSGLGSIKEASLAKNIALLFKMSDTNLDGASKLPLTLLFPAQ